MANISKNSFDASKGYEKVIYAQGSALLDNEFNEAQDLARDGRDRLVTQLTEGLTLAGSAGALVPAASAQARMVDVKGGIALHLGTVVRIPATTNLQVFSNGTTSGTASSLVYVEWGDDEVTSAGDANLAPANPADFGAGNARLRRSVTVKVNIGSAALPAPGAGKNVFKLGVVTHNFGSGAIILASDIAQEPYALSGGELAGAGAARTLRLTSNAPTGVEAFVFDTKNAQAATDTLFSLRQQGTERLRIYADGRMVFGGGTSAPGSEPFQFNGFVKFLSATSFTDNITMTAGHTVDGLDASDHTHDGSTVGGQRVSHANLSNLGGDDHAQYLHLTNARTIAAQHAFAPTTARAPFTLGANAQGQLVSGLNAEFVGGAGIGVIARTNTTMSITSTWTYTADVAAGAGVAFDGVDLSTVADGSKGVAHAKLSGLGNDDHGQYLHLSNPRTVVAVHTFNPSAAGPPFVLAPNARGFFVQGLNAEYVGGQTLANLDGRYLRTSGASTLNAGTLILVNGSEVNFVDGNHALKYVGTLDGLRLQGYSGVELGITRSGTFVQHLLLTATGLAVAVDTAFAQRVRAPKNGLDTTAAPASASVTATASIGVASVGTRALISYLKVDPGAYTGSYDVFVYADNNTTSRLLAKWQGQSGVMIDMVPWMFKNARGDEQLYVQVAKASQTGTAHTFSVALEAERFA